MSSISQLGDDFKKDLDKLSEKSINSNSEDSIRNEIDKLFSKKIGDPFNQEELDAICVDGEKRFELCIPPGFKDNEKEKDSEDCFSYLGLNYKKKFGDLIIWKQIIHFAKKSKKQSIIFITDDNKSDWWHIITKNGKKTIGARPELIDEIYREADVDKFHIYNTEKFLKHAAEELDAKVTDSALEEVKTISNIIFQKDIKKESNFQSLYKTLRFNKTEQAVKNWLEDLYGIPAYNEQNFPDIIVSLDNELQGYEIIYYSNLNNIQYGYLKKKLQSINDSYQNVMLDKKYVVIVTPDFLTSDKVVAEIISIKYGLDLLDLKLVIGYINETNNNMGEFNISYIE